MAYTFKPAHKINNQIFDKLANQCVKIYMRSHV